MHKKKIEKYTKTMHNHFNATMYIEYMNLFQYLAEPWTYNHTDSELSNGQDDGEG